MNRNQKRARDAAEPRWTPKSAVYDQLDILAGFDPSTEGRVAAGAEPVLVRGPRDRGPAAQPALRLDGVDHVRAWREWCVNPAAGARHRRASMSRPPQGSPAMVNTIGNLVLRLELPRRALDRTLQKLPRGVAIPLERWRDDLTYGGLIDAAERAGDHREVECLCVPHPVSWTQVWATRLGVARTPRGPRVACDRPASRGASTGCSARRTRRRRRARRRDFERPGRRRPVP